MLLVLIQLPKKEAGAGMAFGGGATDALFGAGSGTVLTKITKWSAVAFFCLAFVLSILNSHGEQLRFDQEESRQVKLRPANRCPKGRPRRPRTSASQTNAVTPNVAKTCPMAVPLVLTATNIAPAPTSNAATNVRRWPRRSNNAAPMKLSRDERVRPELWRGFRHFWSAGL